MILTLSGGPAGGQDIEVPDGTTEFVIDIDSFPMYNGEGSYIGCDSLFAGLKLPMPGIDEYANERAWLWEDIKGVRDRLQSSGTKVGAYWFHSDNSSRIQQLGLVMMGANIPAGLKWKTMSGEQVTMTPTLAGQIFMAQATHDMTLFAVAEVKKKALLVMQDPTGFDVNSGWPETFVE